MARNASYPAIRPTKCRCMGRSSLEPHDSARNIRGGTTMVRKTLLPLLLVAGSMIAMQGQSLAQPEIRLIGFGGGTNLPSWVAIDKGFFLKEGLKVTQDVTPGSKEQMQDIMAGKYQFASTAFDNIVAYTAGEGTCKFLNYDVVAIMCVHSGINSVFARPEIRKYSDLKGKVAAVDSPTSGYAT